MRNLRLLIFLVLLTISMMIYFAASGSKRNRLLYCFHCTYITQERCAERRNLPSKSCGEIRPEVDGRVHVTRCMNATWTGSDGTTLTVRDCAFDVENVDPCGRYSHLKNSTCQLCAKNRCNGSSNVKAGVVAIVASVAASFVLKQLQ